MYYVAEICQPCHAVTEVKELKHKKIDEHTGL